MPRTRQQSLWTLGVALVGSLVIHPVLGVVYEVTREPQPPRLLVEVHSEGDGQGLVQSHIGGVRCTGGDADDEVCSVELEKDARITLTATPGQKSTFIGWTGPCGPQAHKLFGWAFEAIYGDPDMVIPEPGQQGRELYEQLLLASAEPPPPEFPLSCDVVLGHTSKVIAKFGEQPEEQVVEWVAMADDPDVAPEHRITLPDPALEAANPTVMTPPPVVPPEPEVPELQPQRAPPQIAEVQPPEPEPVPVEPEKVPPPEVAEKKKELQAQRMKAVEVPDENDVAEAPDDARFLSDKNRDVAEETHARDTNLERQQEGKVAASEKSDVKSEDIGGEEDEIAQLETSEASSLDAERERETAKIGKDKIAEGIVRGDEGQDGEGGEGGDDTPAKKPGLLSMRGIEGRGAPGGPLVAREVRGDGGASGSEGDGGKRGKRGDEGRRGIKTQLEFEDYKRIVGDDKVAEEQKHVARRTKSIRRGRWERKFAAVKSSLENFTPEVRPGNQTALKTRAAPFAVYISRMHRRIHELWGFGFLEDLDDKPASHEMNDWSLWTKIEVVVNPDGTVDKVNIVRPSGVLPFDVAALDTILTAGPFEAPPSQIRSADGKTYMHWAFHRDWRQCGTFGAEPFILSTPPKGGQRDRGLSDSDIFDSSGRTKRLKEKAGHGPGDGHDHAAGDEVKTQAARARAQGALASPDDPGAKHAANLWLSGFTHGDIAKMVKTSGVPFAAGAGMIAQSGSEIGNIYRNILAETKSRGVRDFKILTAAGYRRALGALPEGIDGAPGDLYLVVRLSKEQFTVVLRKHGSADSYRAVGFFR